MRVTTTNDYVLIDTGTTQMAVLRPPGMSAREALEQRARELNAEGTKTLQRAALINEAALQA